VSINVQRVCMRDCVVVFWVHVEESSSHRCSPRVEILIGRCFLVRWLFWHRRTDRSGHRCIATRLRAARCRVQHSSPRDAHEGHLVVHTRARTRSTSSTPSCARPSTMASTAGSRSSSPPPGSTIYSCTMLTYARTQLHKRVTKTTKLTCAIVSAMYGTAVRKQSHRSRWKEQCSSAVSKIMTYFL